MIKRFAAIYIGSSKCELVVGQRGKGTINILDRAVYPIDFGEQSFARGKISFSSVYALCQIIGEYIEIAKASAVEEIEIVATAALREAENRIYLLEQIRTYTGGYRVHLLEKEDEIELIYRYMLLKCEDFLTEERVQEETMLCSISSGNIALALMNGGLIDYYQTLEMGYLKIREVLRAIEEETENFENLLSDFFAINLHAVTDNIHKRKIKNLVVTSHDAEIIACFCGMEAGSDYYRISRERFVELHGSLKGLTSGQLQRKYPELNLFEAETMRHTLMFYLKLLDDTKMDEIVLVQLSLCDALVDFKFNLTKDQRLREWIEESSYSSARMLGKKYHVDGKHAETVEKLALKLFDFLKKRYQLDKNERRLLRLTAQLLDVGRYVGGQNSKPMNRMIIENADIIGVSAKERLIIGTVADCVRTIPFDESLLDKSMTAEEQLAVSCLTAILKLATALDKSHKQKISKIQCRIEEREFIITAVTSKNVQLESYFFSTSKLAMRKVFGLKPVLKIKREKI